MKSESQFLETPAIISAFAPEYRKDHYHIKGRNVDPISNFMSLVKDE